MGSLKRASVDVELLAPRSPMGKETMLTFSNTLPRASVNVNGVLGGGESMVDPQGMVQLTQQRLKAVQAPLDPMRSQQLVSEWKQKSIEMRHPSVRDDEASENSSEAGTDDGGSQAPTYQSQVPSGRNPTPPPGGAKAVVTPRPPQIPEAGPPPVSPKSALTRAKWLAIREKASGESGARGASQPRLMQVIAMSKQQGLLPSSSSETTSTGSGMSSAANSPHYRSSPEPQGSSVVTADAHRPLVQAPPTPKAPSLTVNPWEWGGASGGGHAYDMNDLTHGSSFRPQRSASPRPAAEAPQQAELSADTRRREAVMRRKTAMVLLDREIRNQAEQENFYRSLQGRSFRD